MKLIVTKPFSDYDSLDGHMIESIGTQNEKTLHKSIKYYLCEDAIYHEFKIDRFIADIYQDGHITEIQTASFQSLKPKLAKLLQNYPITIVYPVIHRKTIIELVSLGSNKPKKSPKIGSPLLIMRELVKIKEWLNHPHLDIVIFLVDVDEYRMKSSEYQRFERVNQFPKGTPILYQLKTNKDYLDLLPANMPSEWTAKQLKALLRVSKSDTQSLLQVYKYLGLFELTRIDGRAFVYQMKGLN